MPVRIIPEAMSKWREPVKASRTTWRQLDNPAYGAVIPQEQHSATVSNPNMLYIELDPKRPRIVRTVHGVGYRYDR